MYNQVSEYEATKRIITKHMERFILSLLTVVET